MSSNYTHFQRAHLSAFTVWEQTTISWGNYTCTRLSINYKEFVIINLSRYKTGIFNVCSGSHYLIARNL